MGQVHVDTILNKRVAKRKVDHEHRNAAGKMMQSARGAVSPSKPLCLASSVLDAQRCYGLYIAPHREARMFRMEHTDALVMERGIFIPVTSLHPGLHSKPAHRIK